MHANHEITVQALIFALYAKAVFLAGLQAQVLSITVADNTTLAVKFVNALWISAIFLDIFGAVLATMSARWLELLNDDDTEHFIDNWTTPVPRRPGKCIFDEMINYIIATALFSPLGIVMLGIGCLVAGLVIYVWAKQPLLVSIISTTTFAILTFLCSSCFIPHSDRRKDIIECIGRKRGTW